MILKNGKRLEKTRLTENPIIIGSCPRSGSTLLNAILSAHPNIFAIKKQTFAFNKWIKVDDHYNVERLDRLYREFIYRRIPKTATRWCEKSPNNIISFDKILDFHPTAILINLIRDGRDVVTSKHPKHTPDQYYVLIERWIRDINFGLIYQNHPRVVTLKYEDLILNFDKTIHGLCKSLSLKFHPNFMEWEKYTTIRTSKHWNSSVQKIHSGGIGKWKKKEHIDRCLEFMRNREAVKLLEKLDYTIE